MAGVLADVAGEAAHEPDRTLAVVGDADRGEQLGQSHDAEADFAGGVGGVLEGNVDRAEVAGLVR
ncbi:MAG TPA: hypothetical protein VFI47_06080 [Acidimicrobiales bacterium]|nr:hypothetical protein [Acidimicrobiales bacterium]